MVMPFESVRAEMLATLPRLRRFAHALTRTPADADDLVQDTVERALRHLDRWTPGTRMDSWMFRIAQNLWIDTIRARRSRGQSVPLSDAHGVADGGVQTAENALTLSATRRALNELPDDQRTVIALVLIEGMSYREAAAILDIPIGTVTSRLARGREALAARVLGEDAAGALS